MMTELRFDRVIIGRSGFRAGPFDFSVPVGSIVALIGPNGGGKTTMLHTIAGAIPPLSGHVSLPDGTAALLPPPGTLNAPFSARYMVTLGRAGHRGPWNAAFGKDDHAASAGALAAFGLLALADRPFDALSSGQQQLVLLARVLAQDASLCLLDEPTAMLDPMQSAKVWDVLENFAAEGRTLVVATHDLDWARRADLVIGVGTGEVVVATPGGALDASKLSAIFGESMVDCEECRHATIRVSSSRRGPSGESPRAT